MCDREKDIEKDIAVGRFKLFFVYAIDLGHLLKGIADIERLQELRAFGELQNELQEVFTKKGVTAGKFRDPKAEASYIRDRAESSIRIGGKNIWSELFFEKQAPILFVTGAELYLCENYPFKEGQHVEIRDDKSQNIKVTFRGCKLRMFPDGILSIAYEFDSDHDSKVLSVDELIPYLVKLEGMTLDGYFQNMRLIVDDWADEKHPINKFQLRIKASEDIDELSIKSSTVRHEFIFVERLVDKKGDNKKPVRVEDITKQYLLLGLLNKAKWYKLYSEKYIEGVFLKNVGYRKDEIYLTDKNSTLVLLSDYWSDNNPLRYYIDDIVLAAQMQVTKIAYLAFFHEYLRLASASKPVLKDHSAQQAIDLVIRSRNVITLVREVMEIDTLITHGFTRRFVHQLIDEKNISQQLEIIDKRIENINNSVNLQTTIAIAKTNKKLNWVLVVLGVIGVVVAILGGLESFERYFSDTSDSFKPSSFVKDSVHSQDFPKKEALKKKE